MWAIVGVAILLNRNDQHTLFAVKGGGYVRTFDGDGAIGRIRLVATARSGWAGDPTEEG